MSPNIISKTTYCRDSSGICYLYELPRLFKYALVDTVETNIVTNLRDHWPKHLVEKLTVFKYDNNTTRYLYHTLDECVELSELAPKHTLLIIQCSEALI